MTDVRVRRAECSKVRRAEIIGAAHLALRDPLVGTRGDVESLRRLATGILHGIQGTSTHVVVGRGDFSLSLRFAKKSLLYAAVKASAEAPRLRVLVYESSPWERGDVDAADFLAFESAKEEHDVPLSPSRRSASRSSLKGSSSRSPSFLRSPSKRRAATCVSDVEGIPHTIVNSALKVLDDTDIDHDDNDERATALRDELTKKFGSFWHVVSDAGDFAVASHATELPVQIGEYRAMKRVSMRFQKGKYEYEVWHHVAPFEASQPEEDAPVDARRVARVAALLVIAAAAWFQRQSRDVPRVSDIVPIVFHSRN